MTKIHIQSPDPDHRTWEYDGDGNRIYKPEMGKPTKTIYNDEYEIWKARFGHDWEDYTQEEKKKWNGVEKPYYVDLP